MSSLEVRASAPQLPAYQPQNKPFLSRVGCAFNRFKERSVCNVLTTNRFFTINNRKAARIFTAITCLLVIGILFRVASHGTSTLQRAIDNQREDSIKALLKNQSSDSVALPGKNESTSILEVSIERGFIDLANEQLEKMKNKGTLTPLELGLQTRMLARVGAELKAALAKDGIKPAGLKALSESFWIYAKNSRSKTLDLIKSNDFPNPNEIDRNTGNTALHVAIENQDEEMILAISRMYRIDFAIQNRQGNTALHLAVETQNIKLVKHLCMNMKNDDISIKNNQGKSALEMPNIPPQIQQIIQKSVFKNQPAALPKSLIVKMSSLGETFKIKKGLSKHLSTVAEKLL